MIHHSCRKTSDYNLIKCEIYLPNADFCMFDQHTLGCLEMWDVSWRLWTFCRQRFSVAGVTFAESCFLSFLAGESDELRVRKHSRQPTFLPANLPSLSAHFPTGHRWAGSSRWRCFGNSQEFMYLCQLAGISSFRGSLSICLCLSVCLCPSSVWLSFRLHAKTQFYLDWNGSQMLNICSLWCFARAQWVITENMFLI